MKPNVKDRLVEAGGVELSGEFGISLADSAHIMTILRDTLYSDKVLAVLREYSSNAWDAHREVGKADLPIKVVLPTEMDPTLTIRDFGPGLSPDDVFNVYTQYGASTKRSNDTTVGMLGIGSKSAFAYADSFTITSFHGGKKCIYAAVLDQSEKGIINLLHEEDSNETGVMIQVAIQRHDIPEFILKAQDLYRYFVPRPDINTEIPSLPSVQKNLKSGVIYDEHHYDDGEWIAVMGCVSYKVDLSQLKGFGAEEGVPTFLRSISGALFFGIGDVQVNASREGLKYSDHTKRMLLQRFNELVDEYVSITLDDINKQSGSPWDRRVRLQVLNKLKLPVPSTEKGFIVGSVHVGGKIPKGINILQVTTNGYGRHETETEKAVGYISVHPNARLLLRDDTRPLKGYHLGEHDYLVRKDPELTWPQAQIEIEKMLADLGMMGLPVTALSTLPWSKPHNPKAQYYNVKHRQNVFKLVDNPHFYRGKKSENWVGEKRTPDPADIYVLLTEFSNSEFANLYPLDSTIVQLTGQKMPAIYGYKTTEKKPVDPKDIVGIPYKQWSEENLKKILEVPRIRKMLIMSQWAAVLGHSYYSSSRRKADRTVRERIKKGLGTKHPITKFVYSNQVAKTWMMKHAKGNTHAWVENLKERTEKTSDKILQDMNEADKEMKNIYARYPLINAVGEGLSCLWGSNFADWLHYITMIDRALTIGNNANDNASSLHAHP
jgi:hypothetical protein